MSVISSACLMLRSVLRCIHRANHKSPCILSTSRPYTGGFLKTTAEQSKAQLRKFKGEEKHFKRRLRSVYQRFADVPENATFQGKITYTLRMAKASTDQHWDMMRRWSRCSQLIGEEMDMEPSSGSDCLPQSMLAVTVKKDHHEETRFVLVHLEGVTFPQTALLVLDNVLSFEWSTDDVLFYSTQETLQSLRVFSLHLSKTGVQTNLVYEEKDQEFFVEVSRSRDERLVTINCNSKNSSEVWFIDSSAPFSNPTLVQTRQPGLLYHVEHSDNHLFILANTGKDQEYQLLRASLAFPSMPHWVPLFSADPGTVIKDMELLQDHCVFTLKDSNCALQIQILTSKEPYQLKTVQLPHWACDLSPQRVGTIDRRSFSFLLSSPVHPPVHYLCSPRDEQLFVTEDNTQNISLSECNTTRLQAVSQDGTMVPLTLLHMPALAQLSKAPLLLHVYGAYGIDLNMTFSPEKRLLLEDGWALAYCHVRGGGECGLAWHRSGSLLQKKWGVEDLASCIQTLHNLGVSQPALTALTAHSAGAVLAGRCAIKTHSFSELYFYRCPGHYARPVPSAYYRGEGEWGDPLVSPEHSNNIASYCPCNNIIPQLYPSMLITAYLEDCRVPLLGVLNYVERLKKAIQIHTDSACTNARVPAVILDIQPGADHFGPEDFQLSLNESARQIAFLYRELGLNHQRKVK